MRYLFGFLCVSALGVMPLVGCSETTGDGGSGGLAGSGGTAGDGGTGGEAGTGGMGGDGGTGGSNSAVFPCTKQGIVDGIAEGGGPHTFACEGPTVITTTQEIVIDNDVVLDGEGNLIVDGNDDHIVFVVAEGATAELTGFAVTRGRSNGGPPLYRFGGCIMNQGTLALTNCTVSRCTAAENPDPERFNSGGGIFNSGALTLKNSTVSENSSDFWGGGIYNGGTLALTNSTVSDNTVTESVGLGSRGGGGIANNEGTLTLTNSTISGNTAQEYTAVQNMNQGTLTVTGSLIDGTCGSETVVTSVGHNIESPGNTCGFDQTGDQSGVTAVLLDLQPLANNGGPTQTHAITTDSAAFNTGTCELDEDQRGIPRPQGLGCDVGAFESGQSGIRSGLWLGGDPASNTDGTPFDTGWAICFYVNIDGTFLIPSTDCDIDEDDDEAYMLEVSWKNDAGEGTVQGEVGVCNGNPEQDSESIGIDGSSGLIRTVEGLDYVPIENDGFVIDLGVLPGGIPITSAEFLGTFNGDTASGTATWEWSPGMGFSHCELDGGWTAAPAP